SEVGVRDRAVNQPLEAGGGSGELHHLLSVSDHQVHGAIGGDSGHDGIGRARFIVAGAGELGGDGAGASRQRRSQRGSPILKNRSSAQRAVTVRENNSAADFAGNRPRINRGHELHVGAGGDEVTGNLKLYSGGF